jgi:hypothetical protein
LLIIEYFGKLIYGQKNILQYFLTVLIVAGVFVFFTCIVGSVAGPYNPTI